MQNAELLHRCEHCAALNEDDRIAASYGGDGFAWCSKCGCYVWVKGTCVDRGST